ncbi:hypothetical protein MMC12_003579 [Toensbergia leucococca]|nr:hypothetical protein [Toensbergia leucococca]
MEDPLPFDPYEVLDIAKDASLATIRSAHRKLVLTCHPDKVYDESIKAQKSDQFHKVQQSYEVLSDDNRRQRHDETVRLAVLRAEILAEKGRSRTAPDSRSRHDPSPMFEVRGGRIYEERVPARSRSYEENIIYEEPHSMPSKFDDRYNTSSSRRSSGRVQEDKRKVWELDDERERERERQKIAREAEKLAYSNSTRSREKGRRRDSDMKESRKFAQASYETDSDETDTTWTTKRESESKRRHDDGWKRDREEAPRRSSKRGDDYADDLESKHYHSARDYIEKSRGAIPVDLDPRRPLNYRHTSSADVRPQPQPQQRPIPPTIDTDTRPISRRTRTGTESSRTSPKDRRVTEIVEPQPSRSYESSSRKMPAMPAASSAPSNIKIPVESPRRGPHRSATTHATPEARQPSIRRADTMPASSRRGDTAPPKSSRLKHAETHDSGYSSPGTPDVQYPDHIPQPRSTKVQYKVIDEQDDHRTVIVDPEDSYRREREPSPPKSSHRAPDRPSVSTRASSSARIPPSRSASSYSYSPDHLPSPRLTRADSSARAPSLTTRQSSRSGPQLYGEVTPKTEEPYKVMHTSPKLRSEDIRYGQYERRGSDPSNRDAYPGSAWADSRLRPGMARHESSHVY